MCVRALPVNDHLRRENTRPVQQLCVAELPGIYSLRGINAHIDARAAAPHTGEPLVLLLERIVDAGEHGRALTPEADIDVTDDKGPGDTADAQTPDRMQLRERKAARLREYPTEIDEGRQFQVDMCRDGIEG